MTYNPDRIEIDICGTVTRGGKLLGTLAFASISARMDAVGEHYAEDSGRYPEWDEELRQAQVEAEDAKADADDLRDAVKLALDLASKGAGVSEIIKILEAAE